MEKISLGDKVTFSIDEGTRHKKIVTGRVIYENNALYTINGKKHRECVMKNDIHCKRAVLIRLKKVSA